MIFMMALTWVVPAGQFERAEVEGVLQVVPDSYHHVANNPQGLFDVLTSIPVGFANASDIIVFLFIAGGAFKLISDTGFIAAGLNRLVLKLENREEIVIPILIFVFGLAGSTIGLAEEIILLIPIGVALMRALGYDAMVGTATLILGAAVGFNAGLLNPFNVGIAQGIAGLPIFSGIWLRIIVFIVYWAMTTWYILRYARKVKADPSASVVADIEASNQENDEDPEAKMAEIPEFSTRHKWILLTVIAGFAVIVAGVVIEGWFLAEIGGAFFAMGIISAFIGGMRLNEVAETFIDGAGQMMFPALCITFANTILVIMENGVILDTIINFLSSLVSFLPSVFAAVGMYVVQLVINFLIPSGSGQAATTMPIMVPLADTLDITRQTAVLAYLFGSGFMDTIIPTSGTLMAELSIAKIPYQRWLKWLAPLMIAYLLVNTGFLVIAHLIGYGPF